MFQLHLFFYKQLVYEKLALGWQIAEQFSGLNLFLLSNNKNYRLKTSEDFYCNKFIMLLKGNLPLKLYSFIYLSFNQFFLLSVLFWETLSQCLLPPKLWEGATFFRKMLFIGGKILWTKFIENLFYVGEEGGEEGTNDQGKEFHKMYFPVI